MATATEQLLAQDKKRIQALKEFYADFCAATGTTYTTDNGRQDACAAAILNGWSLEKFKRKLQAADPGAGLGGLLADPNRERQEALFREFRRDCRRIAAATYTDAEIDKMTGDEAKDALRRCMVDLTAKEEEEDEQEAEERDEDDDQDDEEKRDEE